MIHSSATMQKICAAGLAMLAACSFAAVGSAAAQADSLPAPGLVKVAASGEDAIAARILALVNQVRAAPRHCGAILYGAARPVVWNETLTRVARAHSEDMARRNYFDHDSPDGSTPSQRVRRAGYAYLGTAENIAAGQATADAVMADWVRSPQHCANLMDPEYTDMGIGVALDRNSRHGAYWTQVFGMPRAARIAPAVSRRRL